MKQDFLYIKKLYIIPKDLLYDGIQDEEIIFKAGNMEPDYFAPGTAFFSFDKKESTSGLYYVNEIQFSVPGKGEKEYMEKVSKAGAVLAVLDTDQKIVFYKNDYFSNTALKPEISSNNFKTNIKYTVTSLDVL